MSGAGVLPTGAWPRPAVLLAALAIGSLTEVWAHATSGREGWDAPSYWSVIYPAQVVASFALGWIAPVRAWTYGAVVVPAQFVTMAILHGMGSLAVVGLAFAALLAVPCALAAWGGGRLRMRRARGAVRADQVRGPS